MYKYNTYLAHTYTKQTEKIYSAIKKNEITAFSEEMDGTGGCIVGKNKLDTRKSVCFCYAELTKQERSESRADTTVGCEGSQCEEQRRKGRRGRLEQMLQLRTMFKCSNITEKPIDLYN